MVSTEIQLRTRGDGLVELTDRLRSFCEDKGDGLVNVFVPHATAGLAIIELGDNSEPDFDELIERLLPKDRSYNHSHGSPGHGADHLTPTIFSPSLTIPVIDGRPTLGTWQHVVLVDRNIDNPDRKIRFSFLS